VIQFGNLKEMLIYAGKFTPYYRKLFSKIGFDPKCMDTLEEIRRIPPLTREILHSQNYQLLAESFNGPTISNHTSGTSGTAMEFTLSEEANQKHYACIYYHFGWVDFNRGEPMATFGGHPVAAIDRHEPPFWLYDRKENDLMFSAHHFSPNTASSYIQKLTEFRPKIIRGFPSMIYLIALYIQERGHRNAVPKGIFTYGETTLDMQRKVIEQAFECPVYSSYGNGERVGHLLQCEEKNFHIVTETGVVEVLRMDGTPAKPGEMGELVVTSLINKAMPMIRYKPGDMVIQGEGPCQMADILVVWEGFSWIL
jgi:phenylacetate-CoA ligase